MPVFEQCRFSAAEIRAFDAPHLNELDRAELLALTAIIERRGTAATVERLGEDRTMAVLADFVSAIDSLYGSAPAQPENLDGDEAWDPKIAEARFVRREALVSLLINHPMVGADEALRDLAAQIKDIDRKAMADLAAPAAGAGEKASDGEVSP